MEKRGKKCIQMFSKTSEKKKGAGLQNSVALIFWLKYQRASSVIKVKLLDFIEEGFSGL